MRHARVVPVLVVGLVGLVGAAGCRDGDAPPSTRAPAPPPTVARAPLQVPDLQLERGLLMGRPVVDGRISIVPIIATQPTPALQFVTLPEGLAAGTVVVREQSGEWAVDAVAVQNNADRAVFAMSGDVIIEARQDRTIAETTVIAPHETALVPVRCVEAHRSSGPTARFRSGRAIAELSIRRRLHWLDQTSVWTQVNAINDRLGLSPPTQTYRLAAALQTVGVSGARRDRVVAALAQVPERDRMVGVALAVDGEVLAIDRFATPALYRQVEPALVASYLPAETEVRQSKASHTLVPDDVRARARQVGAVHQTDAATQILRDVSPDPTPND